LPDEPAAAESSVASEENFRRFSDDLTYFVCYERRGASGEAEEKKSVADGRTVCIRCFFVSRKFHENE
jgi:hypothetical protein